MRKSTKRLGKVFFSLFSMMVLLFAGYAKAEAAPVVNDDSFRVILGFTGVDGSEEGLSLMKVLNEQGDDVTPSAGVIFVNEPSVYRVEMPKGWVVTVECEDPDAPTDGFGYMTENGDDVDVTTITIDQEANGLELVVVLAHDAGFVPEPVYTARLALIGDDSLLGNVKLYNYATDEDITPSNGLALVSYQGESAKYSVVTPKGYEVKVFTEDENAPEDAFDYLTMEGEDTDETLITLYPEADGLEILIEVQSSGTVQPDPVYTATLLLVGDDSALGNVKLYNYALDEDITPSNGVAFVNFQGESAKYSVVAPKGYSVTVYTEDENAPEDAFDAITESGEDGDTTIITLYPEANGLEILIEVQPEGTVSPAPLNVVRFGLVGDDTALATTKLYDYGTDEDITPSNGLAVVSFEGESAKYYVVTPKGYEVSVFTEDENAPEDAFESITESGDDNDTTYITVYEAANGLEILIEVQSAGDIQPEPVYSARLAIVGSDEAIQKAKLYNYATEEDITPSNGLALVSYQGESAKYSVVLPKGYEVSVYTEDENAPEDAFESITEAGEEEDTTIITLYPEANGLEILIEVQPEGGVQPDPVYTATLALVGDETALASAKLYNYALDEEITPENGLVQVSFQGDQAQYAVVLPKGYEVSVYTEDENAPEDAFGSLTQEEEDTDVTIITLYPEANGLEILIEVQPAGTVAPAPLTVVKFGLVGDETALATTKLYDYGTEEEITPENGLAVVSFEGESAKYSVVTPKGYEVTVYTEDENAPEDAFEYVTEAGDDEDTTIITVTEAANGLEILVEVQPEGTVQPEPVYSATLALVGDDTALGKAKLYNYATEEDITPSNGVALISYQGESAKYSVVLPKGYEVTVYTEDENAPEDAFDYMTEAGEDEDTTIITLYPEANGLEILIEVQPEGGVQPEPIYTATFALVGDDTALGKAKIYNYALDEDITPENGLVEVSFQGESAKYSVVLPKGYEVSVYTEDENAPEGAFESYTEAGDDEDTTIITLYPEANGLEILIEVQEEGDVNPDPINVVRFGLVGEDTALGHLKLIDYATDEDITPSNGLAVVSFTGESHKYAVEMPKGYEVKVYTEDEDAAEDAFEYITEAGDDVDTTLITVYAAANGLEILIEVQAEGDVVPEPVYENTFNFTLVEGALETLSIVASATEEVLTLTDNALNISYEGESYEFVISISDQYKVAISSTDVVAGAETYTVSENTEDGVSTYTVTLYPGSDAAVFTVDVTKASGIANLYDLDGAEGYNVVTVNGVVVLRNGTASDLNLLEPGMYIVNGKKVVVRK